MEGFRFGVAESVTKPFRILHIPFFFFLFFPFFSFCSRQPREYPRIKLPKTTVTMASTIEAEEPHHNFDVRAATTLHQPRMSSLEARLSLHSATCDWASQTGHAVATDIRNLKKIERADTFLPRPFSCSISARELLQSLWRIPALSDTPVLFAKIVPTPFLVKRAILSCDDFEPLASSLSCFRAQPRSPSCHGSLKESSFPEVRSLLMNGLRRDLTELLPRPCFCL